MRTVPSALSYRPDIDGLRAIAVLSVVLFHFEWSALPGGFLGVDIFFVISGYLITRLIRAEVLGTNNFRFGHFYLRRTRRLFPALAFTLFLSSIAALLMLSPLHLERFGKEVVAAILSVSNILFFRESGYFDIDSIYKPLLHTWSLGVEEQFYLFWPPLVWLTARWRPWVGMVLLGLGAAASVIGAELVHNRDAVFYLTPFRVFEFAAGAAIVWLDDHKLPGKKSLIVLLALGLAAMLLPIHFFSAETHLPGVLTIIPALGAALTIYAGRAPHLGLILSNSISVWLGRISYSLYLVHWPLITFYHYGQSAPLTIIEQILLPLACIATAALMYRYVEKPFRTAATPQRNRRFVCGVLVVATVGIVIGTTTIWTQGLPGRLDPALAKLVMSPQRKLSLGECQYKVDRIDNDLQAKFDACRAKGGPAILIFGDSHAGDLFNALAHNGPRTHVVGIAQDSCRPQNILSRCYYPKLPAFIEQNRSSLASIIFTQSGIHLLGGRQKTTIDTEMIDKTVSYLNGIASLGIPLTWIGPQEEPNFDIEKAVALMKPGAPSEYFHNAFSHVKQLDGPIVGRIEAAGSKFRYISKIGAIGQLTTSDMVIDGEYTYGDKDHWSSKGEEVFGARLLSADPTLQALFR